MSDVRIAVLGCGRIGRMHAALLATRVPGARLASVFDAMPEAAASVAGELSVPAAASVEQAIEGADAVAVCTSTDTHSELIVMLAEAGLATFCEKPISLDITALDRAVAAVRQAGTLLQIGFNRRFDPAHRAVREAAATGELGDLHIVRITSRDPAPPSRAYLGRSGGLFLDMTAHDFDMARFVTGSEVVEVSATAAVLVDPAIGAAGDVDTAVVTLRHESGCLTSIDNSRRAVYGYDQRVEAFGSAGMAASDNPTVHTTRRFDAAGGHRPPIGSFFIDRYEVSYLHQWSAFVDALVTGGPSPVSGADGRAPLVIGLAAAESVATGRSVMPAR